MPAVIPFKTASAPVPSDPLCVACLLTIDADTLGLLDVEAFDPANRADLLEKMSALDEDGDGERRFMAVFVTGYQAAVLSGLMRSRTAIHIGANALSYDKQQELRTLRDAMCAQFNTASLNDDGGEDEALPPVSIPEPPKAWTPNARELATLRAYVDAMLTRPEAVERAMTTLYALQTADEQSSETTRHLNQRGFSACHARRGSYLARWIASGKHLTGKFIIEATNIALRHSAQLVQALLNGKDGERKARTILTGQWAQENRAGR